MSFRAVLWALKQDLPPLTKLILVALASHADKLDGSCYPRVRTVATKASVTPRTVHRHFPELQRRQLVRIESKHCGKGRRPSVYWLNIPRQPKHSYDAADRGPSDSRVAYKKNHYRNHNNRARQEAEKALAEMLGNDGWEILIACSEQVPLLVGKFERGTLKQSDLMDLRARYTLKGGER